MSSLISQLSGFRYSSAADRSFGRNVKEVLGFYPKNIELYKLAMTHRSASFILPRGRKVDNERLEYLGDAILDAIVADYLFEYYPRKHEGFLTKMRAKIVSRNSLNQIAFSMGLDKFVKVSNGVTLLQKNIYGNALEALIGAIFLDRGYQFTSNVVIKNMLKKFIDLEDLQQTETDYKSKVLELAQKGKYEAHFQTQEAEEHDNNCQQLFVSTLFWEQKEVATGKGHSKKEAEQQAAMQALEHIESC